MLEYGQLGSVVWVVFLVLEEEGKVLRKHLSSTGATPAVAQLCFWAASSALLCPQDKAYSFQQVLTS